MKKLTGKNHYALLCDSTCGVWIICGVYGSREEAKTVDKNVKECPARHKIVKCEVEIRFK